MRKFHLYGILYLDLLFLGVKPLSLPYRRFRAVMEPLYPCIPTIGGFRGGLRGLYIYSTHTYIS